MVLNEYRPGAAFLGVIGRAFDRSSSAWPKPQQAALAMLLAGSTAAEIIAIAMFASVIGWPAAIALQPRATRHRPADASRFQ
jgi:hypothetical protein